MPRLITLTALIAVLWLTAAGLTSAKGGPSYLEGATLSGGGLPHAVSTGISIPDASYEMRPLHAPANGLIANPFDLFVLYQTKMPYEVVLHYNYPRYGGPQDRAGLYDGDRLIYFPGPGTWYETSPRLAKALRAEIFWGLAPADAQGIRGGGIDNYTREILLAMGATILLVVGQRVWQGNNEVASAAEVEARLRNRAQPETMVHL